MKDAKMTVAAGVLVTLCALIGFTAVATAAKKDAVFAKKERFGGAATFEARRDLV
jgi:hypothetical protein